MTREEEKMVEVYDQMQEAEAHLAKERPEEAALIRQKRKELEKQLFGGELVGKAGCVMCGFKHLGSASVKLTEALTAGGTRTATTTTQPDYTWLWILLGLGSLAGLIWLISRRG